MSESIRGNRWSAKDLSAATGMPQAKDSISPMAWSGNGKERGLAGTAGL
jgi:hypothetical protein